jgi:glycosyltransferase involved in cell wall biosynthesis
MTTRINAVIVDADLPYPPTSGKRLRTLHLVLRMAARHRITYIGRSNGDPRAAREAAALLGDHGIEPILVDHPLPPKSGARFYGRLLLNLFSPQPYSVASHDSRALAEAIARHAARGKTDLWQFEWMPYVCALDGHEQVPCCLPNSPSPGLLPKGEGARLLNAHNVDSLIWQRYWEAEGSAVKRWYIRHQQRKLEQLESRLLAKFDAIVTVSGDDAALLRQRYAVHEVHVVENGIDRAYFEQVRPARDPRRILFLGALDYRPNGDAVRVLLDRIWPRVLAGEPSARLCLVGRNPPRGLVRRAAEMPQVELHPNVADVRPFLAQCGVMAVPLRIAGGSRLKILEALASGLPVVSTRVGAEGLALAPHSGLEIAGSIEEMAEMLLRCMRCPQQFLAQAENGRQAVLAQYNWDALAEKLEAVWERCLAAPRQNGLQRQRSVA